MNQSQELQDIIAVIPADFADPAADYRAVRTTFAPFHGHPTGEDFHIDIVDYGGVRCGESHIAGAHKTLTVLHCHGGAFVSTPLDDYHFYAEIIARQTGCRVVMPDYRLAPEHPYPAAPDDCFNAYCGLLQQGTAPETVILMGESCGGSLAMSLLLRLREEQLPMPACFISLTGWFDLSVSGEAVTGRDPFLTAEWVRNRGRDYLAGKLPLDDPRVSPAYARLQGLPPMYLQIGEFDTVREGAVRLGKAALGDGVVATVEDWPGMIQGLHGLVTAGVPEATAAWQAISAYIERTVPGC